MVFNFRKFLLHDIKLLLMRHGSSYKSTVPPHARSIPKENCVFFATNRSQACVKTLRKATASWWNKRTVNSGWLFRDMRSEAMQERSTKSCPVMKHIFKNTAVWAYLFHFLVPAKFRFALFELGLKKKRGPGLVTDLRIGHGLGPRDFGAPRNFPMTAH